MEKGYIKITALNFLAAFLIAFLFSTGNLKAQVTEEMENSEKPTFFDIKKEFEEHFEGIPKDQRRGWKQYKRWEYFWSQRLGEDGKFPDLYKLFNEYNEYEAKKSREHNVTQGLEWENFGPTTLPKGFQDTREQGLGRINVIRFDPINKDVFWIGSASGGIWKTTDAGATWSTFPFTQFLSIAISDIAISKTNPDIVYAATGDANGSFSTAGEFYSIGIIKTTDGGATWDITDYARELSNSDLIGRIILSPNDHNILIAATRNGIYKSIDGGASYDKKTQGNIYFKDMEFHPTNPQIIYATTFTNNDNRASEIWKSADMGETWTKKLGAPDLNNSTRIALEVSRASGAEDYVYALVAAEDDGFHSFWISEDAGENFDLYSDRELSKNILGRYDGEEEGDNVGQAWYDLCLAVSPEDPFLIWSGGINLWKTEDGSFFQKATHWQAGEAEPYVHADHHDLAYHPITNVLYCTNDGGVYKYENDEWVDITEGMSITQFYKLGVAQTAADFVIGGSQDNGTSYYSGGKWTHVLAGDGMDCAIDPTTTKFIFASQPNGTIWRSVDGGVSFQYSLGENITDEEGKWVSPIIIDPNNTSNVYVGHRNLWRSAQKGQQGTWKNITNGALNNNQFNPVAVLAIAPSDSKTLYAATRANIFKTKNITDWENIGSLIGTISGIAVDNTNPDRIWVSLSNYSNGNKVFYYNPDTKKFENITGDLPNTPVNDIVYHNDSPDRIFAATDYGVFYSVNNSPVWRRYGNGLPNVIVEDLEIAYNTNELYAASYGMGIWKVDIIDCDIEAPTIEVSGELEFCDGDSIKLTATPGFETYEWNTGEVTSSIWVKESDDYYVTVEDEEGCIASSEIITVTVLTVPPAIIQVDEKDGKFPLCEGDTEPIDFEFTGHIGFDKYKWSTGDTERRIQVTAEGAYYYKGTTADGCEKYSDTLYIKYHALPDKPEITRQQNTLISSEAETYQWYLDDEPIEGAIEKQYQVSALGTYTVEITDSNTCANISEPFEVTTSVRDADNIINSHLIKPNPGQGLYNIELDMAAPAEMHILITNSAGEEVYNKSEGHGGGLYSGQINLEAFPNGMYFITVKYGNSFIYEKIIKR